MDERFGLTRSGRQVTFHNDQNVDHQIGEQNITGSVYHQVINYLPPGSDQPSEISKARREELWRGRLLKSLHFSQIDVRQATIKKAHAKTCRWFFAMAEFNRWLDASQLPDHHGLLWVKGKPGIGKSTLMKFIQSQFARTMDSLVISFYFNARGSEMERSLLGAYQALLYQLLIKAPALQTAQEVWAPHIIEGTLPVWTVESLREILHTAILQLGQKSLTCFIDALDECDEQEIRELVSFFEELGEDAASLKLPLRFCFSSRHYPHITVSHGISVPLEQRDEHVNDIIQYLHSELRIGRTPRAEAIRTKILDKSCGIFLWVALVLPILNRAHDRGRDFDLENLVRELPVKLEELFQNIVMKDVDLESRREFSLCIQWVLCARKPLTPLQLYYAIRVGQEMGESTFPTWLKIAEVDESNVSRFILDCSRGLVETTKPGHKTVQFIHESVREFFLYRRDCGEASFIHTNLAQNHEELKHYCNKFLVSLKSFTKHNLEDLTLYQRPWLSFFFYATDNILYHSDVAAAGGFPQQNFLDRFDAKQWIFFMNLFCSDPSIVSQQDRNFWSPELFKETAYPTALPLLCILEKRDLTSLLKVQLGRMTANESHSFYYGTVLYSASLSGQAQVVRLLVENMRRLGIPKTCYEHALVAACSVSARRAVTLLVEAQVESLLLYEYSSTALVAACAKGSGTIIDTLLSAKTTTHGHKRDYETPLIAAAARGRVKLVQKLMNFKTKVAPWTDVHRFTILKEPPNSDVHDVFACLIRADPQIMSNSTYAGRVLTTASRNGRADMVDRLLHWGADSNVKYWEDATALILASSAGHIDIVKALIGARANLNTVSNFWGTALHAAAARGHLEIAFVLIKAGADPSIRADYQGRISVTALRLAEQNRDFEMVNVLRYTKRTTTPQRSMSM